MLGVWGGSKLGLGLGVHGFGLWKKVVGLWSLWDVGIRAGFGDHGFIVPLI